MDTQRPIDEFVKHSQSILQKEYVVIGKRRISSVAAWSVIAFFIGITIAIAFLASRSGMLEGSSAARAPRPVWSRWSKAQEGTCEGKTSDTQQCRSANVRNTVIEGGKRKRVTVAGFQTRSCQKNCESLAGAQFQQQRQQQQRQQHQGQQNQFAGSTGCTAYNLGGETPSLPVIQAFNNHLFVAVQGNPQAGYQTFVNEWDPVTKTPVIPDIPGKAGGGWLWVQGGATSDTPQLTIEGTKLAMYVKGWAGGPLDAAFRTEYTGTSPDYWTAWSYTGQGAAIVIPGPFTTTLNQNTYSVSKDTDSSILLKECGGTTGSGNVTVSKTYLEVSPSLTDTEVKLDNGSFVSTNPAVFTNVSVGAHTLTIEVPANTKAFYAICTNANRCQGPLKPESGVIGPVTFTTISFVHTLGQNDFIHILYFTPSAVKEKKKLQLDTGLCDPKDGWGDMTLDPTTPVNVPTMGIWDGVDGSQEQCSKEVYIADTPGSDLYSQTVRVITDWDDLTTIELKPGTNGSVPGTATYIPGTSRVINGITSYDDIDLEDGINLVGYSTDDFDTCTNPKTGTLAGAKAYTSIHSIRTPLQNYITEFDISLNPSLPPPTVNALYGVLAHEMGHGISLTHNSLGPSRMEGSIMSYEKPAYKRDVFAITGFDAGTVNNHYNKCRNSPPKKASITLEVTNQPTPSVTGLCAGYPDITHWKLNTTIKERGNTLGVTLQNYIVQYFDTLGNKLSETSLLPFENLTSQGDRFPKGFSSNSLSAGSSMGAFLCQIPWKPEKLGKIRLKLNAKDELGNSLEAWEKVQFIPEP